MPLESEPSPEAGLLLDKEHPWPGPVGFTEANRSFFFGRDQEIEELLRLVPQEVLTVFFGKSGYGKSSILRAGLSPQLRQMGFIPVYVRLNHSEDERPLEDQVREHIKEAVKLQKIRAPEHLPNETLWEYFHKDSNVWMDQDYRPVEPVLIFDQFEELLTLGHENPERIARAARLLVELEDLTENRPPDSFRSRLKVHPGLADRYEYRTCAYRVILTLREDFLPDLESLRQRLRAVMLNRVRLRPMSGEQALEVVLKPNPDLVDEDVALLIVDSVAEEWAVPTGSQQDKSTEHKLIRTEVAKRSLQPFSLCVILHELNRRRLIAGEPKITSALVRATDPSEVFHDFYLRALESGPLVGRDKDVRKFIESKLLTSLGARNRIAEEDALLFAGITPEIISHLVQHRIIQREKSGRTCWLELTHDRLAEVVQKHRAERDLQFEIDRLARQEAEAQELLKRNLVSSVAFAAKMLHEVEQNSRIRTNEKLFLAEQFTRSARNLEATQGLSGELSFMVADLLAMASRILFDVGRIDEASSYAWKAQALLASQDAFAAPPLIAARVLLSVGWAQRYAWQTDAAKQSLAQAEAYLPKQSEAPGGTTLSVEILRAKIAVAQLNASLPGMSYTALRQFSLSAISAAEETVATCSGSSENAREIRGLLQEILSLHLLRYSIALDSGKDDAWELGAIKADFDRTMQHPFWRSLTGMDGMEIYFEAKGNVLDSAIEHRHASHDQAHRAASMVVARFQQLVLDDPANLLWRFHLGGALYARSEEAKAAGKKQQAHQDQGALRKIAATLRRDQINRHFFSNLTCLVDWTDGSPRAFAAMSALLGIERQRLGNSGDLLRKSVFAHLGCIKINLAKKLYADAIKEAESALKEVALFNFDEADSPSRIMWQCQIYRDLLAVPADELGRVQWMEFYNAAQDFLKAWHPDPRNGRTKLAWTADLVSTRAEQYVRDGQYHDAVTSYEHAIAATDSTVPLTALQNYLFYQRKIMESYAALKDWEGIVKVGGEVRSRLSSPDETASRHPAVLPYIHSLTSSLYKFRRPLYGNFFLTSFAQKLRKLLWFVPNAPRQSLLNWFCNKFSLEEMAPDDALHPAEILKMESRAFAEQRKNLEPEKPQPVSAENLANVDLQSPSLSRWKSGEKNGVWLLQQPLGWSEPSAFPATWLTLVGKEFHQTLRLVVSATKIEASRVRRIRSCQPTFYWKRRLIEAEYLNPKDEVAIITLVANDRTAFRIDGKRRPYQMAFLWFRLRLRNAEETAAYLRFFCAYIRADLGAFYIVESSRDLPWTHSASYELRETVGRLLRPLSVWPDPEKKGCWRASATIQHGNSLHHAIFSISKRNSIKMEKDELVAKTLPLNFYDSMGDKVETLDLTAIVAPASEDAVLALLDMAEAKELRPTYYLELAEDAAQLETNIGSFFAGAERDVTKLIDVLQRVSKLYIEADRPPDAARWQSLLAELQQAAPGTVKKEDAA